MSKCKNTFLQVWLYWAASKCEYVQLYAYKGEEQTCCQDEYKSKKRLCKKKCRKVNKVSVSYLIMSHYTLLHYNNLLETSPFFRLVCPPGRPRSRSGSRWSPSLSRPSRRSQSEARLRLRASLQTPEHNGIRSGS